jgi:hypothetical protein
MPGMLYRQKRCGVRPESATAPIIQGGGLPDLSDPATLGCLLALVREAWGKPHAYVEYSNKWKVAFSCDLETRVFSSTIEAAALVAALEVAP